MEWQNQVQEKILPAIFFLFDRKKRCKISVNVFEKHTTRQPVSRCIWQYSFYFSILPTSYKKWGFSKKKFDFPCKWQNQEKKYMDWQNQEQMKIDENLTPTPLSDFFRAINKLFFNYFFYESIEKCLLYPGEKESVLYNVQKSSYRSNTKDAFFPGRIRSPHSMLIGKKESNERRKEK